MLAALLLLGGGLACGPNPADELRKELAKLKQERIDPVAVEKARAETAAARVALERAHADLEAATAERAAREKERDGLESRVDRATALNRSLRQEIDAGQQRIAAGAARVGELDGEIARLQARALFVRNQADVYAREIRSGDVAGQTERRLRAWSEFLARIAKEYANDPAVLALAEQAAKPGGSDAADAAANARRLRDHFENAYELQAVLEKAAEAAAPVAPVATGEPSLLRGEAAEQPAP